MKSFSTVRSMENVSTSLQNTIRAMFVLIGSDPKSVQEWKKAKQFCSPAGHSTLKKRMAEISPLLKNMTERVSSAVELTKGHESFDKLPNDWLAGFSCHTWVHGVMYACGVDDPRNHLNQVNDNKETKSTNGGDKSAIASTEFGHDSSSGSSNDGDTSSSDDDTGSESSSDDEEVRKKGLKEDPKPPPTISKRPLKPPPPQKPNSASTRIKTTPRGVSLPPADFVPEMKKSSDEDDSTGGSDSSEFMSSDEEKK